MTSRNFIRCGVTRKCGAVSLGNKIQSSIANMADYDDFQSGYGGGNFGGYAACLSDFKTSQSACQ